MDAFSSFFSAASIATQADGSLLILSSYARIGAWLVAFLVLAALSVLLVGGGRLIRLGFTAGVLALGILFLVVPAIVMERVEVSPDHLRATEGFWFAPTRHTIDLEGLAAIHERSSAGRFGSRVFWNFEWHDGKSLEMRLPDLLAAHQTAVTNYLHDQGVHFVRGAEKESDKEPHGTFAAIAFSPETRKYGYATEGTSRLGAEREARNHCGAEDARVVAWVHDGYCALAIGEKGAWGTGWSAGEKASSKVAKEHALTRCKKRDPHGRVVLCIESAKREPEPID